MSRNEAEGPQKPYGMELALRGVSGPVIQQMLEHGDPRTTAIYTRPTRPI